MMTTIYSEKQTNNRITEIYIYKNFRTKLDKLKKCFSKVKRSHGQIFPKSY